MRACRSYVLLDFALKYGRFFKNSPNFQIFYSTIQNFSKCHYQNPKFSIFFKRSCTLHSICFCPPVAFVGVSHCCPHTGSLAHHPGTTPFANRSANQWIDLHWLPFTLDQPLNFRCLFSTCLIQTSNIKPIGGIGGRGKYPHFLEMLQLTFTFSH